MEANDPWGITIVSEKKIFEFSLAIELYINI